MSKTYSNFWKPFFYAFAAAMGVGVLGAVVTKLGPWYASLVKPSWQPPDWLFGPVWTLIFALSALSAVLAWRKAGPTSRTTIVTLFLANAALNILWSALFFRFERPDWALYEVGFLWLSVLAPMVYLRRFSITASWLLVPYLAWVTFASILNYKIVQLNPIG